MQTSIAKKLFAVGSASAMILASLPLVASAAVHAAGSNVVSNGTVYWINASGQKQAYTSAGAFLSYGFNSWSNVVAASAEDLALPSGAFVPPMDGSLINDNGTVYLMTSGTRAGFTSAANFTGLGYSFANVIPGDTSFLVTAPNINTTAMAHPVGTLVNQSGTVYLMTSAGKMGIPSLSVFNSWGYSFSKVVPANSYDAAIGMNSGIMLERMAGQLNPTGTTVTTPTTGNVSVGLATDNPASRAVVSTEGLADLAHFTFNGSGAVTAVTLKRIGISADTSLSNVFLFEGGTRLTDAASVSSGSLITFTNPTGLFTVNGPKTISVKADMAGSAGETVGIQLVSAMTGSTAVNGTPVTGNLHTLATASLATVALGSVTASGATDPGTDVLVWQSTATVGVRDVLMTRMALRQIGSIQNTDINNFKLYADGVQVGTASTIDANGYVTFNVSKVLTTGARVLRVTANVVGGSGRNVSFSLRGAYDISLLDTQYNAGVKATGSFALTSTAFNINAGNLTVVKTADSASQNVTLGASDQSLAKYTFTAYGESVRVETLRVGMITPSAPTNVTVRNVRLLVNGSQVGSTTNVPAAASFAAATGTSFTTNFTVVPGTPATIEIRGDIVDVNTTSGDDFSDGTETSIQALLVGGTATSNAVPQVSLGTINVPSQTNVTGNTLTIATGSMSLAKQSTYTDQSIVSPQTAYKIGAFNLVGNSTEVVNVNTLEIDFAGSSTEATVLTDVYLKYGNTMTSIKGTVTESDNTWSVNFPLGVNETMSVEVYASINSTLSTSTIRADLTATGVTAQSGTTVYADLTSSNSVKDAGFQGQTITGVANGTITATLDASTPISAIVDDNSTLTTAAYKFAAVNDSFTITDMTIAISDVTNVATINLKDGATIVASRPAATSVTFSGLNVLVGINQNKILTTELVLGTTGVGAGTSGAAITTSLSATGFTARSSGGTSDVSGNNAGPSIQAAALDGNAMYVYKAIPTISNVALPTSTLAAGTQVLAKVSVASNGTGTVGWKKLQFNVIKTSAPTLASFAFYDADTNTAIGAAITGTGAGDVTVGTPLAGEFAAASLGGIVTVIPTVEQQISGSKTYELRATVAGSLVAGDSVISNIASSGLAHVAPTAYGSVGATATFIWSDQSASAHTTSTNDWSNDNLVRNLSTSSQALQK